MTNPLIILLAFFLLSLGLAFLIIYFQLRKVARQTDYVFHRPSLLAGFLPIVDRLTLLVTTGLVRLGESLYFHLLLWLRRLATVGRRLTARTEQKFSHWLDKLKGRRPNIGQGGSVSLFLAEIKHHQNELRSRLDA